MKDIILKKYLKELKDKVEKGATKKQLRAIVAKMFEVDEKLIKELLATYESAK